MAVSSVQDFLQMIEKSNLRLPEQLAEVRTWPEQGQKTQADRMITAGWIIEEQTLPVGWSCECIRQSAVGLEHAFEQGMVHRDIKPSNLLVTQHEEDGLPLVKILDLGLARFASETHDEGDLTRSGQVLG